ncbi:MAG: hypothetical protein GY938_22895 [Ketobacter sp.]|nr:hypothetical protein [Ketobacter sp.]
MAVATATCGSALALAPGLRGRRGVASVGSGSLRGLACAGCPHALCDTALSRLTAPGRVL